MRPIPRALLPQEQVATETDAKASVSKRDFTPPEDRRARGGDAPYGVQEDQISLPDAACARSGVEVAGHERAADVPGAREGRHGLLRIDPERARGERGEPRR